MDESGLKAAGIAVIALDTGRVLMQQRALNPVHCPCGMGVTWDEMNGYQHSDGSVSHDGEYYGQSVSDLLDQGHHTPCTCCQGTGEDEQGSECLSCDGSGSDAEAPLCSTPCRSAEADMAKEATADGWGLDKTAALEFDPHEGTWEFPGGKLDEGESPRDAAIREFREEVGQDLPPGIFVGAWVSPGGISVTAAKGWVDPEYQKAFYDYADHEVGYYPHEVDALPINERRELADSFGHYIGEEHPKDARYHLDLGDAGHQKVRTGTPGRTVRVLRIEKPDGSGPFAYGAGASDSTIPRVFEADHPNDLYSLLNPYEEDDPDRGTVKQRQPYADGIPARYVRGRVFGFLPQHNVNDYFTPRMLRGLHDHGYGMSEYDVPGESIVHGRTQTAWRPQDATLVSHKPLTEHFPGLIKQGSESFFHGSTHPFSVGDEVSPDHSRGYFSDEFGESPWGVPAPRVFFTKDLATASRYGEGYGTYRVEPTGPYSEHPFEPGTLISARPLRVIEKVARRIEAATGFQMPKPPVYRQFHDVDPRALDDESADNAYKAMAHDPYHPAVQDAYDALERETVDQLNDLHSAGLHVQFHDGGNDYPNSKAMVEDVGRGHLWTRHSEGDGLPADHPMSRVVGKTIVHTPDGPVQKALTLNDVFRAVHDVNGHAAGVGHEVVGFGPKGEFNAWLRHRTTYSDGALPALWNETRGQAAQLGPLTKAGVPLAEIPFVQQKAGVPPQHLARKATDGWCVTPGRVNMVREAAEGDWRELGLTEQRRVEREEMAKHPTRNVHAPGSYPAGYVTWQDSDFPITKADEYRGLDQPMVGFRGSPGDIEASRSAWTRTEGAPVCETCYDKRDRVIPESEHFMAGHDFKPLVPAPGERRFASVGPVYKGFIYLIQKESDIDLGNREIANPDDPDGDMSEQSAWWDIEHAKENPALREEVKQTPWDELELWADKSVRTNKAIKESFAKLALSAADHVSHVWETLHSGDGVLKTAESEYAWMYDQENEPEYDDDDHADHDLGDYEQDELFPMHEPHHYYHSVSGRPGSPDSQALFDSQKAKTEQDVAGFKQMYQHNPDAAPKDMVRHQQLKLLGPEWKYVRGKGGFARSAYKNVDGASHHVTVVDPIWRGGPNNHEALYHHQMMYPTGETARKYVHDIDGVFGAVEGQHRTPDDSVQWPQTGGGRWGQPRTRAPFTTDERLDDRQRRADRREELLENDKFDPEKHRSFPDAAGYDKRKTPQWNVLHDSLYHPQGTQGPKGFTAGSISGQVLPNGDYQWKHYALPIATAKKDANGNRSITMASEGRDWSGSGGWGPSTRSVTYDVYSQLKQNGHHVKWDDDVLPSDADDQHMADAGFKREGADYTRTSEGRRGNLMHHRIIPLGGMAGGQYQIQTYVNGLPKRVRMAKKNYWDNTPAPITSAEDAIKEIDRRHKKYGSDKSAASGHMFGVSMPAFMRMKNSISVGRPEYRLRTDAEVPEEHHYSILGNDVPQYYEEKHYQPGDPKIYGLRSGLRHTFLAPVVHKETGEKGWLRGGDYKPAEDWTFYQEHQLPNALRGARPDAAPPRSHGDPSPAELRYKRQRATGKPASSLPTWQEGDRVLDDEGHQVVPSRPDKFWPAGMERGWADDRSEFRLGSTEEKPWWSYEGPV